MIRLLHLGFGQGIDGYPTSSTYFEETISQDRGELPAPWLRLFNCFQIKGEERNTNKRFTYLNIFNEGKMVYANDTIQTNVYLLKHF